MVAAITIRPWEPGDLGLLRALNTEQMWAHLGGPETDEAVRRRHERFLASADDAAGRMFAVLVDGERAGSVGYWDRAWRGRTVYETGWMVLPEFAGRGVATAGADAALAAARLAGAERGITSVVAFPAVENAASNAVCRRLGFTMTGEENFEFPPGRWFRCCCWALDLSPEGRTP